MTAKMDFYKNRVLRREHPELTSSNLIATGAIWIHRRFRQNQRHGVAYILHACVDGSFLAKVGDDWVRLCAGDIYMTSPAAAFSLKSIEDETATIVWGRFESEVQAGSLWPIKQSTIINGDTNELLAAYNDLFRESLGQCRPRLLRLRAEVLEFLFRQAVMPGRTTAQLLDLWHSVDTNLRHRWSLPELAQKAHMSQEKLRLLCKSETGMSPMRYVTHLRLRKAAELFEEDDVSVQEAADLVGYESVFAFSRTFKRHMNVSPQAYRKNCRLD